MEDIVTRLRNLVGRCTHGNERFYNGPEGIETYFKESCGLCGSWDEAVAEIERLREENKRLVSLQKVLDLLYEHD